MKKRHTITEYNISLHIFLTQCARFITARAERARSRLPEALTVSLYADGLHIAPEMVRLAYSCPVTGVFH